MKNKKIISLICALAMVFSMFSAFTVANAENVKKGIALSGTISKDNKVITLVATAVGTAEKVQGFGLKVNVPNGVTIDNIEFKSDVATDDLITNVKNGILTVSYTKATGQKYTNNVLVTATITLPDALADDYVATLTDDAMIEDENGAVDCSGAMEKSSVTIVPSGQKPPKADRPDENTDPDPVEPDKPTPVPPVGKGIGLTATLNKTNDVLTLVATAVGTAEKVQGFGLKVNVPDGVTIDNIEFKSDVATDDLITNVKNGILTVSYTKATGQKYTNNVLVTATITLPAPATAPIAMTLTEDAMIEDENGAVDCSGTMTRTTAVAELAGSSQPTGKTVSLKDYVAKEGPAAAATAKEAGKTVYMTVDVTDKDGNAAAYGTDYVAEYPAGTQLTKKAYENLIHGYTADVDMADVINNLKFVVYNSTNANKIKTTLNTVEDKKQLVDPTEKVIGGKTPATPKPSELTLKPTLSVKSFYVNTAAKINVDITSGDDYKVENGDTVEFVMSDSNKYIDFYTDNDPVKDEVAKTKSIAKTISNEKDGAASTSVNITALSVTGTAKVTVNFYKGDIEEDEKPVATKDLSVKVIKKNDGGGNGSDDDDDDDSSSTGSSIAGWNPNQSLGTLGQFTDIGSVDWAKKAITTLALKGIVSGDGNGLFRPNDNITRAEYCQILIGAINKTNEYADSSFADVPSDAWFYHAVSVASANGIVSGYGDGNFGPYDLITRQDMALMTYKAAQVMNKNTSAIRTTSFADAGAISDYAATAVQTLADAGIINGVSDTEFAPIANATRAQAAKILYDTFLN